MRAARTGWLVVVGVALSVAACDLRGCGCGGAGSESSDATSGAVLEDPGETRRDESVVGAAVTDDAFAGAGLVLPRPAELEAWVYVEAPAYYSPEDLSALLGDAAAAYSARGLFQAAYARLQLRDIPVGVTGDVGLEVYVFRMASPEAARQKWDEDHLTTTCRERDRLTVQHCLTDGSLDVLSGPYYVRLVLDADAPVPVEPMVAAAERLLERLSNALRSTRPVPQ